MSYCQTFEDYLRGQVERGQYGVAIVDAKIALDIAEWIEKSRNKETKTGKWIGNEFGECSVCGHKGCASDIWDRCEKYYCPNCGALLTDSVSEDVYQIEDAEW